MRIVYIFAFLGLVLMASAQFPPSPYPPCTTDADCVMSGCNSGICDLETMKCADRCKVEFPRENFCDPDATCVPLTNECVFSQIACFPGSPCEVPCDPTANDGAGACVDPCLTFDDDICTVHECQISGCFLTERFLYLKDADGVIFDCATQKKVRGQTPKVNVDPVQLLEAQSDDACVEVVTLEDGSSGFFLDECTQVVTVSLTNFFVEEPVIVDPLVTQLTVDTSYLSGEYIEGEIGNVIETFPITIESTDVVVASCEDVDVQDPSVVLSENYTCTSTVGTLEFDGTTESTDSTASSDCDRATSILVEAFDMGLEDCNPTVTQGHSRGDRRSNKRQVESPDIGFFTGNYTVAIRFDSRFIGRKMFFKNWEIASLGDEIGFEKPFCAYSRCYWKENNGLCDKSAFEDQFPTAALCGLSEQEIFDADIADDAWLYTANEYLTAANNYVCSGLDYSNQERGRLISTGELLADSCDDRPVQPGPGRPFGAFISAAVRVRVLTRTRICTDQVEEEFEYCTPSLRQVLLCNAENATEPPVFKRDLQDVLQNPSPPSAPRDCYLIPVTKNRLGHYQKESMTNSRISPPINFPVPSTEPSSPDTVPTGVIVLIIMVGVSTIALVFGFSMYFSRVNMAAGRL